MAEAWRKAKLYTRVGIGGDRYMAVVSGRKVAGLCASVRSLYLSKLITVRTYTLLTDRIGQFKQRHGLLGFFWEINTPFGRIARAHFCEEMVSITKKGTENAKTKRSVHLRKWLKGKEMLPVYRGG